VIWPVEGFDDEEAMTHTRVVVFDDVVYIHKSGEQGSDGNGN
jgi:hypothetical protein